MKRFANRPASAPAEHNGKQAPRPWQFGGEKDPAEHGRRGGIASGATRRGEPEALARKLARMQSPQATYGLLRMRVAEENRAWRQAAYWDSVVSGLMDEADAERRVIARLKERRRELEAAATARLEALEQREAELRAKAEAPEGLAELLADVPEARLEAALIALGHQVIDVEDAGDAAAAQAT